METFLTFSSVREHFAHKTTKVYLTPFPDVSAELRLRVAQNTHCFGVIHSNHTEIQVETLLKNWMLTQNYKVIYISKKKQTKEQ